MVSWMSDFCSWKSSCDFKICLLQQIMVVSASHFPHFPCKLDQYRLHSVRTAFIPFGMPGLAGWPADKTLIVWFSSHFDKISCNAYELVYHPVVWIVCILKTFVPSVSSLQSLTLGTSVIPCDFFEHVFLTIMVYLTYYQLVTTSYLHCSARCAFYLFPFTCCLHLFTQKCTYPSKVQCFCSSVTHTAL